MTEIRSLAAEWARMERQIDSVERERRPTNPVQRRAARVMFHAGAQVLYDMIDECEDASDFVELIVDVKQELAVFRADLEDKVTKITERRKHGKINRGHRSERPN